MLNLAEHAGVRPRSGSPAERFTSRDWAAFPEPSGKDETWRFTPLRKVRELLEPTTATGRVLHSLRAPDGVTWSIVPSGSGLAGRILQPVDRASAVAWEYSPGAAVVTIEADRVIGEPVILTLRGEQGIAYSHVVVRAAPGSKATVVVEHVGSVDLSQNVEVIVEENADLTLATVHRWEDDTVHLATHTCTLGAAASLKHVVVNVGGHVLRTVPSVRFNGAASRVEMLGVGVAGERQHIESRLYVDHASPDCSSDVLYKNVLTSDSARTVWIGDVRIRPEAKQTATYEMNRNLLLETGARADSVPNLEIETGDVAEAGHASATGRFDDEQLFYLAARGIPRADAQRLVVRGFLADVVGRIDLQAARDHIMTAIDSRLSVKSS